MKIFSHPNLLVYNTLRGYARKCFKKVRKKVLKKFADIKKVRTFVPGEMAEWSIAAVLKTVELRGSGGSNPSLSAENESSNKEILNYQLVKDFFFYTI